MHERYCDSGMSVSLPIWRSMLFVPAHVDKFVARAHTRGADAYILDLEDSVPPAHKAPARNRVIVAARQVSQSGAAALVRVNAHPEMAADLDAVVDPAIRAIVLPKVGTGVAVRSVAARIDVLERDRAIEAGHTRLIAQIEDVSALLHLDEIAGSSPRLLGMILGSEDFSASAGMVPMPEALFAPNQQIVFACRRAGILAFGFPASIADFSDLDVFRSTIRFARHLGFVGAFCIHPDQIRVINEEFLPSAAELAHARGVVAAYQQALAEGRGAFEYEGRMVDPPVVVRAYELLSRGGIYE